MHDRGGRDRRLWRRHRRTRSIRGRRHRRRRSTRRRRGWGDGRRADGPEDGAEVQIGDTIGDAEVIFVGEGEQRLDAPLVNGTTYHYRVYAFDGDHNYSVSAPADATPRPSLPAGFDDVDFDLAVHVESAKAVREADGTIHVAILGSVDDALEIHYARCDTPCADAADWSSVLVDDDASDVTPAISLDAEGRPWLRTGILSASS